MEVGYTLKFQYSLKWFGDEDEMDRARMALLQSAMYVHAKKGMRFVDHIYEKDSEGNLHVHAHCRLDKKVYNAMSQAWKDRYETFKIKGFTIKLEHAKSIPGWKKYMLKNVNTKEFFLQGTALSQTKLRDALDLGSRIYDNTLDLEIRDLERLKGSLAG